MQLEISARTPQEQYEIANLACELLPSLPNTGMFAVDYSLTASFSSATKYTALPPLPVSSLHPLSHPPPPLPNMMSSAPVPGEALLPPNLPPHLAPPSHLTPPPHLAPPTHIPPPPVEQPQGVGAPPTSVAGDSCSLTSLPPPPPPPPATSTASDNADTAESVSSTTDSTVTTTTTTATSAVWQWQEGRQSSWPAGVQPHQPPAADVTKPQEQDPRKVCLESDPELAANFLRRVFNLLYEVYYKSAGPAVKHRTLKALLRMVHFANPVLLEEVIRPQHFSSQLATMLSSNDLKIVVSALQLAELLMNKLQEVFSVYFRREGVLHQIKKLSEPPPVSTSTPASRGIASAAYTPNMTPTSSQRNSLMMSSSGLHNLGSTNAVGGAAMLAPPLGSTNAVGGAAMLAPPLGAYGAGSGGLYASADWLAMEQSVNSSVALSASPLLAAARSINDSLGAGETSMSLSMHNASMPHLASVSPMIASHMTPPIMGSSSANSSFHSSLTATPSPNPPLVHNFPPPPHSSDGLAPISQLLEPNITPNVSTLCGAGK